MTVEDLEPIFKNEYIELYPQQKEMIYNSVMKQNYLLLAEQGTGKSLMGVYIAKIWLQLGLVKKVLIITKREVMDTFYNELLNHIPFLEEKDIAIMRSNDERNMFTEKKDSKVFITDFNQFKLCHHFCASTTVADFSGKKRKLYKKAMGIDQEYGCLLDETQALKNIKSDVSKIVKKELSDAMCKVGMSATPIEKIEDFYGLFQIIAPKAISMGYPFFMQTIAEINPYNGQILYYKEQGVKRLRKMIEPYTSNFLKKTDIKTMVSKEIIDIPVEFTPEYKAIYDAEVEAIRTYKDDFGCIAEHKIVEIIQRVYNVIKRPAASNPRFLKFDSMVRRLSVSEKLVIWETSPDIIDALYSHYNGQGIKTLKIHGGVNKDERAGIIKEFDINPSERLLICSTIASCEGWSIPSRPDLKRMIYFSLPNSMIQFEQSTCRIHRVNSMSNVSIYRIILNGSIDNWASELLNYKKKLNEGLISKREFAQIEAQSYEKYLGINKKDII